MISKATWRPYQSARDMQSVGAYTAYPYGPCVRIRATFGPPTSVDLIVEVMDKEAGWRELDRFNDSEPNAHERAADRARAARRSLIEGENP